MSLPSRMCSCTANVLPASTRLFHEAAACDEAECRNESVTPRSNRSVQTGRGAAAASVTKLSGLSVQKKREKQSTAADVFPGCVVNQLSQPPVLSTLFFCCFSPRHHEDVCQRCQSAEERRGKVVPNLVFSQRPSSSSIWQKAQCFFLNQEYAVPKSSSVNGSLVLLLFLSVETQLASY